MKMVYVLIDAEVGAGKIDLALVDWLNKNRVPYRLVGTKIDKIGRHRHLTQQNQIGGELGADPQTIFWVSSDKREGLLPLQEDIANLLGI